MPGFASVMDRAAAEKVAAFLRVLPAQERQQSQPAVGSTVFLDVRRQLDSAVALRSPKAAFGAYLTFEQVETEVRARNPTLAGELEDAFGALRARAAAGAPQAELEAIHARLLSALERAERVVVDKMSSANLFMESFVLMLREGFEAILIVAAL
jgi:high-affinity iron transporter